MKKIKLFLISILMFISLNFGGCTLIPKVQEHLSKDVIKAAALKLGKRVAVKIIERIKEKSKSGDESSIKLEELSKGLLIGLYKLEQADFEVTIDGLDKWFKDDLKLDLEKHQLHSLQMAIETIINLIKDNVKDEEKQESIRESLRELVSEVLKEIE